jgi:hypothetical protein
MLAFLRTSTLQDDDDDLSPDTKLESVTESSVSARRISVADVIIDVRQTKFAKKAIEIARNDLDATCRWLFPLCYFGFVIIMLILLACAYSKGEDCHFSPGLERYVA